MRLGGVVSSEPPVAVLDRMCTTVAEIGGCEAAVIAYNRNGRTRILASHGIDSRFRIYQYDLKGAPFKPREFVVKTEAGTDPYYNRLGAALGIPKCEFFLRAPISITEKHATSLILLSGTVREVPTAARLKALREAAILTRDQLSPSFPLLDDDSKKVSALTTSDAMIRDVKASKGLVALINDRLQFCAISKALARIIGRPVADIVGRAVTESGLDTAEASAFLFRQALETGVSPPEYEIVRFHAAGGSEVYSVSATPLSPTDTEDAFLYLSVRDVTVLNLREASLNRRFKTGSRSADQGEEPSLRFLLDTLVRRRTLRERNGVSYLTFESWRQSIRTYQIAALKALKQRVPAELSQAAAGRLAEEINSFVGTSAFKFIVPMPCSNSRPDSCLSLEIARSLGALTGLPVIQCLQLPCGGGSSHPKKNARRPRMSLTEKVAGPALLIDDVATSGAHLEEATKLLRPVCGAVLAIAWIGSA
jgi:hypothetical protein